MRMCDWRSDVCSSDLRDLRGDGAIERGIGVATHAPQRIAGLQVAEHVDVARLLEADAERLLQRVVEQRLAGEVAQVADDDPVAVAEGDGRLRPRSEEHTSELQSLMRLSYALFCLKKKQTPHIQSNAI